MTQITKCSNNKCKAKETCYRFVATASVDQSYLEYKPTKNAVKIDCNFRIAIAQLPYLVKDRPESFSHETHRSDSYNINEDKKARKHNPILRSDYHNITNQRFIAVTGVAHASRLN